MQSLHDTGRNRCKEQQIVKKKTWYLLEIKEDEDSERERCEAEGVAGEVDKAGDVSGRHVGDAFRAVRVVRVVAPHAVQAPSGGVLCYDN